ncbi:hypothetical protein FWF89_02060 [Candidatus Saccharibacteria bacterium]|nr:hypothetical protein [Candidatus Saccharibacteria bacterium]
MPRNPEIDRLKERSDQAFADKQAAYDRMKPLGDLRSELRAEMDASWDKVQAARLEMNRAFERQQNDWDAYKSERNGATCLAHRRLAATRFGLIPTGRIRLSIAKTVRKGSNASEKKERRFMVDSVVITRQWKSLPRPSGIGNMLALII